MNPRGTSRPLAKLFERHGGKDVVSRFAGFQDGRGGAAARS
jgi:hypothetical protein